MRNKRRNTNRRVGAAAATGAATYGIADFLHDSLVFLPLLMAPCQLQNDQNQLRKGDRHADRRKNLQQRNRPKRNYLHLKLCLSLNLNLKQKTKPKKKQKV